MAGVFLDRQSCFTFPVVADLKPPHQDGHNPRNFTAGASPNDAVLISSDDESDYGVDDGQSDIPPPMEELYLPAIYKDIGSNTSASSAERSFNGASSTSVQSDTKEPSVLDYDSASSQQQTIPGLHCSELPSSIPLPASPGRLQAEQDQPIPAGSPSCEMGQASAPEDTTCSKLAEEICRASLPGVQAQHTPRPSLLSIPSPPQLEEATNRESTPHRDLDGESDDESGPPLAKLKSNWTRNLVHQGVLMNSINLDKKKKAMEQSNDQDDPQSHLGRRRRDNTEAEDIYYPPEGSEGEQDEEDDDDVCSLRPKRRKISSSTQSTFSTATGRRARSYGATSTPHVQGLAPGPKRSGERSIPRSPQAYSDEEETAEAPAAKYEEWPLGDAVLKRTTVNGLPTFQLQFTWDPCTDHRRKTQYKSPVKRRPATNRGATRVAFMPAEDSLLVKLKNQNLSWKNIHMKFNEAFPERSMGTLQVRYCTKLKQR